MILADTSAWVEFDRATGSEVDRRLTEIITASEPLGVTQPVIMELTAGARNDEREQDIRRLLGRFDLLNFDAVIDFDAAARIYRTCRRAGVTPRGIDCMIAAIALRYGATLLAQDGDLTRVAAVMGIPFGRASPQG
ncbi:MAG: PIN domain nuclease [Candidatus Microthrix sp.]|nr:PIN domain nuclease [Candidatus Microthrix sp.]MBK7019715.1 PIN domain nuclease [Candidatus Microthrix sp.]